MTGLKATDPIKAGLWLQFQGKALCISRLWPDKGPRAMRAPARGADVTQSNDALRCTREPARQGANTPRIPVHKTAKNREGIIAALLLHLSMACTHLSTAARLRRSALIAELPARACALRKLHTCRHGIPTAFVSLSGVTAMLSAAVRMA